MNITLLGVCYLSAILLIQPTYCKETQTCIPRISAFIQDCHRFSIKCDQYSYIRFKSLHYHWSECLENFNCLRPKNECCDKEESSCQSEFSMMDIYGLFEKCGGQDTCAGTALDVMSDRNQPTRCKAEEEKSIAVPIFLSMDYDCIKVSKIINICEESQKVVNNDIQGIHFMYKRGSEFPSTKEPTQCTCTISFQDTRRQPVRTLAYQDIRLHRYKSSEREASICSSVHLTMSTSSKMEERHCTSSDPLTSFYVRESEPVDADLTITLDSLFREGSLDEPEMIWLSLEASSPVSVACGNQKVASRFLKTDEEDDDSESIATIIVPVICVAIVIACLITVVIVLRRRKRGNRKLSLEPGSRRSTVRGISNEDVYDTIDDFSRQSSKYSKTETNTQGYSDAYSAAPKHTYAIRHITDAIADDDYNRINLRVHEVSHDPEYNRLQSDTDSGVVDSFGISQINANDDSTSDRISDHTELPVFNGNKTYVTNTMNENCDNINTEREEENKNAGVRRRDSYEIPEMNANITETKTSDHGGLNNIAKEDREIHHDENSLKSMTQKNGKRRDSYETPSIQTDIGLKVNTCISDYETAISASSIENPSADSADYTKVEIKYENEDEKTAENVTVALPHRSNSNMDSDSDSD